MKQTKEDKLNHSFDKMSDRDLMLNFRINLEKAKSLADSANRRSQDAAGDVRNMESAMVRYLDKTDSAIKRIDRISDQVESFLSLPWYKRLFYKGPKNARK